MPFKSSTMQNCYCAFCRSPRRVYIRRKVALINIAACALGAVVFTYGYFRGFDPRGILIFIGFMVVTEIFLQVRWRLSLTCRFCGFDPILYSKDISAAVAKVQRRLDERKNDPSALLMAPLNLPKQKRQKIEKETLREEAIRRSRDKRNLVTPGSKVGGPSNGQPGQIISKQL